MKRLGALLLLGLMLGKAFAQDYRFSQFYNAPLSLSPALSGRHDDDYRLNADYRNQWSSISNAFKTIYASYDMPMFEDIAGISKLGFGISFLSDKAGSTNYGYTNASMSLAYHLKTNRYNQLSAGILLGYGQGSVDLSNVRWESQHNGNNYDPSAASGELAYISQVKFLDAGMGFTWSYYDPDFDRRYEFGLSATHLNFPNHSFEAQYADRLKPKLQLYGQIDLAMNGWTLCPKFLVMNQGPSYYYNIGSLARFRLGDKEESRFTDAFVASHVDLGVFYRYNKSLMLTMQYEHKRALLLAISYDITLSQLSSASRSGGIEIALRYQGKFNRQRIKVRKNMEKINLQRRNPKETRTSECDSVLVPEEVQS